MCLLAEFGLTGADCGNDILNVICQCFREKNTKSVSLTFLLLPGGGGGRAKINIFF